MKRNIWSAAIAGLSLMATSCSNGYTLTGRAPGAADGDTVFLCTENGINIDTTIISRGVFTFTGQCDTTKVTYVRCELASDGSAMAGVLFLENSEISIVLDKKVSDSRARGTQCNEAYNDFRDSVEVIVDEMSAAADKAQDTTLSEAERKRFDALSDSIYDNVYVTYHKECALKNIGTPVGVSILSQIHYVMSLNEIDALLQMVPDIYRTGSNYVKLADRVERMKRVDIGQPFIDIVQPGLEGDTLRLSDIASSHKVVVVDFWASWCGPCRREMPEIVELYAKYKDQGLEIVGVSHDSSAEAWRDAIQTLGMTWPQMSELKRWDNEAARAYAINSIPNNVVIKDGIIRAHALHGEELEKAIAELLAE